MKLSCYAPGNGCLAFSWTTPAGQAAGKTVSKGEIASYLRTIAGKKLIKAGFRRYLINSRWCLAAPLTRINSYKLVNQDTELTYTLDKSHVCWDENEIHDKVLLLVFFPEWSDRPLECVNMSIRARTRFFLTHEKTMEIQDKDRKDPERPWL